MPSGRVVLRASADVPEGQPTRHERELVIGDDGVELGTVVLDNAVSLDAYERRKRAREGR